MNYPDQNSLRDAFRVLVRGVLPALVVGGALGVAAFWVADRRPAAYSARASLLIVNSGTSPGSFDVSLVTAPRIDAAAYRAALHSGPVLDDALRFLGDSDPSPAERETLADDVEVTLTEMDESGVIEIVARAAAPEQAAARANALAQALLEWDQRRASRTLTTVAQTLEARISAADQQIASLEESGAPQAQIDVLLAQRNDLSAQLSSARALMTSAVGRLEVLDPAPVPAEPEPSRAVLLAIAAFLAGAFLVYTAMIVGNAMDTRIRTVEGFTEATGVPVITGFERPRSREHRVDRETANYLRAHVLHATAEERPAVIAVTSPHEDPSRPKVAAGLAESIARSGLRTLLVDANLRSPKIGSGYRIRLGEVPDLETYLTYLQVELEAGHVSTPGGAGMKVIPASGSDALPSELLERGLGPRIAEWRRAFDVIVIETPPVLEVADVLSVAPHATGVVLVADLGRLKRRDARQAVEPFRHLGTPILGAAVSGAEDGREAGRRASAGANPSPRKERRRREAASTAGSSRS